MASIVLGDVEIIVHAGLDEFYKEAEEGADEAGEKAGESFSAAFNSAVDDGDTAKPAIEVPDGKELGDDVAADFTTAVEAGDPATFPIEADTADLEKGLEDVSDQVNVTVEDFDKGFEDVGASVNETAGGFTDRLGGAIEDVGAKFDKVKKRMIQKIVMTVAIAGITYVLEKLGELREGFDRIAESPADEKLRTIREEAAKFDADPGNQIAKFLGIIPDMTDAVDRAAASTGTALVNVGSVRDALVENIPVAGQLQSAWDTLAGAIETGIKKKLTELEGVAARSGDAMATGMESAAPRFHEAVTGMADDVEELSEASERTAQEFETDFDAMLQTVIDSRDPVDQAAKAYAKALRDPLTIDDRLATLQAELERVAPDLTDEAPNVRAAAILYTRQIKSEIEALQGDMYGYGTATVSQYAAGWLGQIQRSTGSIAIALDEWRSLVETHSPPGPGNVFYGIGGWARDIAGEFTDRFEDRLSEGIGAIRPVLSGLALPLAPGGGFSAGAGPRVSAPGPTSSVSIVVQNPAPVGAVESTRRSLQMIAANAQ